MILIPVFDRMNIKASLRTADLHVQFKILLLLCIFLLILSTEFLPETIYHQDCRLHVVRREKISDRISNYTEFKRLSTQEKVEAMFEISNKLLDATDDKQVNLFQYSEHLEIAKRRRYALQGGPRMRPDTCSGCMKYTFTNLIKPVNACREEDNILLFIIINTFPHEVEERKTLRETWVSLTRNNTAEVRHLFIFGSGYEKEDEAIVKKESVLYGDILQDSFIDNYYNFTIKTLGGFHWVTNNCKKVKFIMKTSCDNFINLPKVLRMLLHPKTDGLEFAQIGSKTKDLTVQRQMNRRMYVSKEELNPRITKYPPFCNGAAFMFHIDAAKRLLEASVDVPFFVIEEAYIGMVMEKGQIPLIHVNGFAMEGKEAGLPGRRGCPKGSSWYSVHELSPVLIHQLWRWCEKNWILPCYPQ